MFKYTRLFKFVISVVLYIENAVTRKIKRKKSLILLNVKALKADFKVAVFVVQKFIKQKDVKPINSHPKNSIIIFPDATKNIILTTKDNKNKRNLSTSGSYLKYEKAKI